jgi:uncharacterized membrane protein
MESKVKLLGHPIHPMLIPFPLGLLGMAVIFDLLAIVAGQEMLGQASHPMIAAAIFGAIDWAAIPDGTRAKGIGTSHSLAIAWWLRRDTPGAPSGLPLVLQVIGVRVALVTGWLGGELVDRLGVGVDRGANLNAPSSLSGQPADTTRGTA